MGMDTYLRKQTNKELKTLVDVRGNFDLVNFLSETFKNQNDILWYYGMEEGFLHFRSKNMIDWEFVIDFLKEKRTESWEYDLILEGIEKNIDNRDKLLISIDW